MIASNKIPIHRCILKKELSIRGIGLIRLWTAIIEEPLCPQAMEVVNLAYMCIFIYPKIRRRRRASARVCILITYLRNTRRIRIFT